MARQAKQRLQELNDPIHFNSLVSQILKQFLELW
jgi:hypothetical protein